MESSLVARANLMDVDPTFASLEWASRVILAVACAIHSILDITDPFTGAKSGILQIEDSIPHWLLPTVGILRGVTCVALLSKESYIVLGGLAYCSMLWCGAVYFHLRREHHPAATVPACFFVLLVFAITAMRISFWMALAGQMVCASTAVVLGRMFVTPPGGTAADRAVEERIPKEPRKSSCTYSPPHWAKQPKCRLSKGVEGSTGISVTPSTAEALM